MESAIPEHLKTARSRHRRVPVVRVVMAYFGVQTPGVPSQAAEPVMGWIVSRFGQSGGPSHWDRAR